MTPPEPRTLRHWWSSPTMWLFAPLYVLLLLADRWAKHSHGNWRPREPSAGIQPGLSVVVPERGTPYRLIETLDALCLALAGLEEPFQVIVVVNGTAYDDYSALRQRFDKFEWLHSKEVLGYHGAVSMGLEHVRHAWCYLLNSDMVLSADALTEVAAYRQAEVFCVASQIFFVDTSRRREETGWADFHLNAEVPHIYDRECGSERVARGGLYGGGGSSLFRTTLLRRYVAETRDYAPFYWEDADWGVRAWSEGWKVIFCPTSHARHHHRSTIGKFHTADEIARIIRRNAMLFDLRHGWTGQHPAMQMHRIAGLPRNSQNELRGVRLAWRAAKSRLETQRAKNRGFRFEDITQAGWYRRANASAKPKPRVLLVTPFALFPPSHGGARRITEIIHHLRNEVDFILLSDEASHYEPAAETGTSGCYATHVVEGRGDLPGQAMLGIEQRMRSHAWQGMRLELHRLIALYQPDLVQVEFMELALLAEERRGNQPWLLSLHDVYVGMGDEALQHQAIARYAAVIACSQEDVDLLSGASSVLIPNGAEDRRMESTPSPNSRELLFMGPFRYEPNRLGIIDFLRQAWPLLRTEFPDIRLTILGGAESAEDRFSNNIFQQAGVHLVSHFVDPGEALQRCALTINPQMNIRGSSIKLVESLLAGRMCVSTKDGARGFDGANLRGLVTATDIAGMAADIAALLRDPAFRWQHERADFEALASFTWQRRARQMSSLYSKLLGKIGT